MNVQTHASTTKKDLRLALIWLRIIYGGTAFASGQSFVMCDMKWELRGNGDKTNDSHFVCVCFFYFLKRFSKVIKHAITSYKKCDKHEPQCPVNIVLTPSLKFKL